MSARGGDHHAHGGGTPEELANALGEEVYADLNGWRLYLKDMQSTSGSGTMAQDLATAVGSGTSVEDALRHLPIAVGGGKKDVSLFNMVPSSAINNARNAVKDLDR